MVAICHSFHGFNGSMVLSRLEVLKQIYFLVAQPSSNVWGCLIECLF